MGTNSVSWPFSNLLSTCLKNHGLCHFPISFNWPIKKKISLNQYKKVAVGEDSAQGAGLFKTTQELRHNPTKVGLFAILH